MNAAFRPLGPSGLLAAFRRESGYPLALWGALVLMEGVAQIFLRHELAPGEFATFNTLLGVVGLLTVPMLALHLAFACFRPRDGSLEHLAAIRSARLPAMQTFAMGWGLVATLLLFPLLYLLSLPRSSLGLFVLPNVLLTLAAWVGATLCEGQDRFRFWSRLLFLAGLARLLLLAVLAQVAPWAESGLAAGWLAGLILLTPVLRLTEFTPGWGALSAVWRDREFGPYLAATFSVVLGIFLFINGDRMVAQAWFGRSADNNMGLVHWGLFDGYQTAGLLARALLWGTQPLLVIFFAARAPLARTTTTSLQVFWVYLGALFLGTLALRFLAAPLAWVFGGGDSDVTAYFLPSFALAMVPIGLLQGIGVFALASRRYPECFTLGGSGVVYTGLLYVLGRPQLMLSYVFGGGLVALALVLLIGLVRWGRRQP